MQKNTETIIEFGRICKKAERAGVKLPFSGNTDAAINAAAFLATLQNANVDLLAIDTSLLPTAQMSLVEDSNFMLGYYKC